MTDPPRYSVLIPAYNHALFVEEAVTSALEDGGDLLEVIIVDDGSSDDTPAVLRRLAADDRVTVHTQENQGAHAALNRLLGMARGEFVFILNSDDAFESGRLERLATTLEEHPVSAVACSTLRIVDDHGQQIGLKNAWRDLEPWPASHPPPHLADLADATLALLQSNWVATTSNMAFRRSLVVDDHLQFNALRYTHDWDFLLAASAFGKIVLVEEPLIRYRVHDSNTIRESDDRAQATMHFEILWTVARHAASTLARATQQGFDPDDLRDRLMRSLPSFGREDLLFQLLTLRGSGDTSPPSYDALLNPEHPLRRAAILALEGKP
jgi:glycosyltransferase involved in cell wall biosynthesis